MATERIIDLANRRYADRECAEALVLSQAPVEAARARRQELALARLRARAADHDELALDVLTLLGLDE
jgi:hypothetical protein